MLSYEELLLEIGRRSREEKLSLLEDMIHSLKEEFTAPVSCSETGAVTSEKKAQWPPDIFEQTYGMFSEDPLERLSQGEYKTRDELLTGSLISST